MGKTPHSGPERFFVKLPPRLSHQRQTTWSFLGVADRYSGSVSGPKDLSSNPKYLSDLGQLSDTRPVD